VLDLNLEAAKKEAEELENALLPHRCHASPTDNLANYDGTR
jgi:hypothetical protein